MRTLLYRIHPWNGGVVFANEGRAQFIALIHKALSSARTWDEFKRLMPSQEYQMIRRVFDEQCEPRPRLDEEFLAEYVSGVSDGDYPPWLQTEMERIIPQDILRQFGKYETTFLNGSYWHIPKAQMEPMANALRDRGFEVIRAEHLPFH